MSSEIVRGRFYELTLLDLDRKAYKRDHLTRPEMAALEKLMLRLSDLHKSVLEKHFVAEMRNTPSLRDQYGLLVRSVDHQLVKFQKLIAAFPTGSRNQIKLTSLLQRETTHIAPRAQVAAQERRAEPRSKPVMASAAASKSHKAPAKKTEPAKPVFVDIEPYREKRWEEGVAPISRGEICGALDGLAKEWCVNFYEEAMERIQSRAADTEEKKTEGDARRTLNKQIFAHVKQARGDIATPMELLWSMQGFSMEAPIPIAVHPITVTPEEGQFYKFENFADIPLRLPGKLGDAVEQGMSFGAAIKREKDKLYLYMDGISQCMYTFINGKIYPHIYGRGVSRAAYLIKEGDVVCSGGVGATYLFTVGKNGSISYPEKARQELDRNPEAFAQSVQFARDLDVSARRQACNSLYFTSDSVGAVIDPSVRLEPGFSVFCEMDIDRPASNPSPWVDIAHERQEGDLLFVDSTKDPILRGLVAYLKEEFAVMGYTDEQKMTRLALLADDLLKGDVWNYKMKYNYLLGEILRAGRGVCRHRAPLIKTLADELGLQCALVQGAVHKTGYLYAGGKCAGMFTQRYASAHAWNIMVIGGRHFVVDSMNDCIFPVDNPPGKTQKHRETISNWYGLERLQRATGN